MCGGLVTSCSRNKIDILNYQLGRLLGYILLGLLAGVIGSTLKMALHNTYFTLIPSLFVGAVFIFWGIQGLIGGKRFYPGGKTLSHLYQYLWKKFQFKSEWFSRAFMIGFISLFLPCGLLYGVVLGTLALQSIALSVLVVIFFWLGTLPAMMIAPSIVQKLLKPLSLRSPRGYAVGLMFIGIATIVYRVYGHYFQGHHHH